MSAWFETQLQATREILARLHRDERGIAMTEEVQVMILVSVAAAVGAAPVGLALMRHYEISELMLALPTP